MKANEFKIMSDAVEYGIDYGWRRAYKHTDKPSEDGIKREIFESIMNYICENFVFDEPNEIKTK